MERLTQKQTDGSWTAGSDAAALERLAQYESMHEALEAEYVKICADMERLRSAGRTNSATYRQLLGSKLTVRDLLDRIELYVK